MNVISRVPRYESTTMIVGIVIPLVAKCVSKSWERNCQLVTATIKSILQQSDSSFHVAVVGHDCPQQLKDMEHAGNDIFYEFSDLAPPVVTENGEEMQLKYEFDRCSKVLRGIMHLKEKYPNISHWFAMDSDDLIHKDFIKTLLKAPKKDAYLIKNGYFHYKNVNVFTVTNEFYTYCGSSSIIADKYFNLPATITETSFKSIPFGAASHVNMGKYLDKHNIEYHIPEKKLLVYVLDTGTNISDFYIKGFLGKLKRRLAMFAKMKRLNKAEKQAFAITTAKSRQGVKCPT